MTPVRFEPTQLALVKLESTPSDHSGKVSLLMLCGKLIIPCLRACILNGCLCHNPGVKLHLILLPYFM